MALSTAKVEFSKDDLTVSNASAVWTDISDRVLGIEWWGGKANDLDAPTSGGATIVLDNDDRRFEPDYSASPYYPAIQPGRRFKITVTADAVDYPQGMFYAESWDVSYEALTTYAQVSVSCDDGFGVLSVSTLPTLSPLSAATYEDVITADGPFGYWPLNETSGRTMGALNGPEGQYKGAKDLDQPNPVVGDVGGAVTFGTGNAYGRAFPDDTSVWHDSGAVTMEAVITYSGSGAHSIICGPETGGGVPIWQLVINGSNQLQADVTTSGITNADAVAALSSGSHHVCATYDGGLLSVYIDGALVATDVNSNNIVTGAAGEDIKIGGQSLIVATVALTVSHAAVYDYALSADQITAHATAALSRGYAADTTGNRVADLATNALWSVAGITGGQVIDVEPRMQTGQSVLEEIILVAAAEQPTGMFWFNDDGNPAYQGYDYDATVAATLSDTGGSDTEYTSVTPKFDNEYYTQVTIARENGPAQTRDTGATPIRGYSQTGLILNSDADADLVSAGVFDLFNAPLMRFAEVSLDGLTTNGRTQILTRDIGDTIRIKVRNDTGEPIDVITRILGKHKTWTPDGNLACTWQLSRGLDASQAVWHLGVPGYSELGSTTILA